MAEDELMKLTEVVILQRLKRFTYPSTETIQVAIDFLKLKANIPKEPEDILKLKKQLEAMRGK